MTEHHQIQLAYTFYVSLSILCLHNDCCARRLFYGGSREVRSRTGMVAGGPVAADLDPVTHCYFFPPVPAPTNFSLSCRDGSARQLVCRTVTERIVGLGRHRRCHLGESVSVCRFFSVFIFFFLVFHFFPVFNSFLWVVLHTAPDWLSPSQGEGNSYIRGSK
jgi:hypothetical protein